MKIGAVMTLMTLLLLYVWERVDLVQVGYRIQQLNVTRQALEREHGELKVKVSALTSPERIARLATERLGMVRPLPGQVVLMSLNPEPPAAQKSPEDVVRVAMNKRIFMRP